jgi:hypothetical protein
MSDSLPVICMIHIERISGFIWVVKSVREGVL